MSVHPTCHGQVLYDGSLGTLPGSQGWSYFALGSATQTLTNSAVVLDTSVSAGTQAGYSRTDMAPLDRTNGFTLVFSAQINSEAHSSTNRAGFSIIVLADDKRGVELGFWTNVVFAQSDSPLFTHAEDALLSNTNPFVSFALTLLATNYVLRADGAVILSGPIRDYTAFSGPINPYRTPDFIFLGDDTTSAGGSVGLRKVVLVKAPLLTMVTPDVLSWVGVSNQTYRVETSTDLAAWTNASSISSASTNFYYTNSPVNARQFYRVGYPSAE
jgi:hypothetical protein